MAGFHSGTHCSCCKFSQVGTLYIWSSSLHKRTGHCFHIINGVLGGGGGGGGDAPTSSTSLSGRAPRTIRLFINQPQTIDFDTASDMKAVQEFV